MVTCDEKLPESELNELLCEFKGGAALSVKMTFCEKTESLFYTVEDETGRKKEYEYNKTFGESVGEKAGENDGKNIGGDIVQKIEKPAYKPVNGTFGGELNKKSVDEISKTNKNSEAEKARLFALEKKRVIKRFAKLSLYDFLCEKFKTELPWGALTGIRPTKLYYQQPEKKREEFLKGQMRVSQKKLEVLEKIATAQKDYYCPDESACAFYVGIPFCPTRCQYCSFISCEISKCDCLSEYVDALCKEIEESKKLVKNLRSVYIGGGTPSSIPLDLLEKVLKAVGEVSCEYTVEAGRADCINEELLTLLKNYGVKRVCVNPQTFCDDTLKLMGRNHTAEQAEQAYLLAKSMGFLINMDLIAGLPLETFETFKNTIEKALFLRPDNLTVHTLCLKKGSKLKELCERLPECEIEKMIDYSSLRAAEEGYSPYYLYRQKYMAGNLENTGYSLKGRECVYNIDVMEEITQNVACGANAVSKRVRFNQSRIERYGAPKDIHTYINKIDEIIKEKQKLFAED
ncbi:MAG: coproporphyrinogen dehydrogenase HemZ [Candidatus Borkfalkiaceae bacterium]|nr:coproporphyrinogen dehydrogenase HemZ [Christensenellaceae bacterium]